MRHDWIMDVLTDLRSYARTNGLHALAEQLDDARLLVQVELASQGEDGRVGICGTGDGPGRAVRAVGNR